MTRPNSRSVQPGPVELLEEAVHLLRRHPFELAGYYAGTGAFAVALLYAWARVTWFAPEGAAVAVGALGLTLLFGVMKVAQHRFARRLYAARAGEPMPEIGSWRDWLGALAAEFRLQAAAVGLLPLAAALTVPFGWLFAYFQSVSVVAGPDSAERRREAWALALLWPKQNHWALLVLSGLWFVTFLNVTAAFYVVPMLATKFLGLKTMFAVSGWSFFNTTMLVLLVTLTHLVVEPLIKAFYVLRVFHGRARHTGADIRLVLRREQQARARSVGVRVALMVVGLGWFAQPIVVEAATGDVVVEALPASPPTVRPTVSMEQLDRSVDEVLTRPEFSWRLRPQPKPPGKESEDGAVKNFVRATFNTVGEIIRDVFRWLRKAKNWIADLFPDREPAESGSERARPARNLDWMNILQIGAYVLLFVVLGVLLLVAWRVWKHNRLPVLPSAPAAGAAGVPDLHDENVEASRLPADGWLALAREKMAAGEWRLALRALFLASLARLASEGLVTLARFKTNHDYERELRRRARERVGTVDEFRTRRRQFEDTWYGNHPTDESRVAEWLRQLEAPR